MKKKKVEYTPYCELCTGCGEDGCCNHIGCFSTLINNPKCKYGQTYLNDARFARDFSNVCVEIFENLKSKKITSDDAIIEYDKQYDMIYDKIYYNEEKTEKE